MYQLYKSKLWIKQNFLCVHDWEWKEYGVGRDSFATCQKCGKFTDKT